VNLINFFKNYITVFSAKAGNFAPECNKFITSLQIKSNFYEKESIPHTFKEVGLEKRFSRVMS
jgi:hypothetical protein